MGCPRSWDFELLAESSITEVTLRWEGPDRILEDLSLIDNASGEVIPLWAQESYDVSVDGRRLFSIRQGIAEDPTSEIFSDGFESGDDSAWSP